MSWPLKFSCPSVRVDYYLPNLDWDPVFTSFPGYDNGPSLLMEVSLSGTYRTPWCPVPDATTEKNLGSLTGQVPNVCFPRVGGRLMDPTWNPFRNEKDSDKGVDILSLLLWTEYPNRISNLLSPTVRVVCRSRGPFLVERMSL